METKPFELNFPLALHVITQNTHITQTLSEMRACLVGHFNQLLEYFKHTNTHFYTLFHSHVYQKHSNNITQTPLPNTSQTLKLHCLTQNTYITQTLSEI